MHFLQFRDVISTVIQNNFSFVLRRFFLVVQLKTDVPYLSADVYLLF